MPTPTDDKRNAATLIRQYEMINKIKRELVKQGLLTGDATPQQLIEKLRLVIPQELWT